MGQQPILEQLTEIMAKMNERLARLESLTVTQAALINLVIEENEANYPGPPWVDLYEKVAAEIFENYYSEELMLIRLNIEAEVDKSQSVLKAFTLVGNKPTSGGMSL